MNVPGIELDGVRYLRNLDDAASIRQRAQSATTAVIVGGGHIGLETAAALRFHGVRVTVVEAFERLLARVTCPAVSDFYYNLHRDHGVDILLGDTIASIQGRDGRVFQVQLESGRRLPADLVVVGVGLTPSIEPLALAGAAHSNGVDTDLAGRTTLDHIYAAGDCANREHPYAAGERIRLESIPNATETARIVASTLLGSATPAATAPWFWSHQYDVKMQTVGILTGFDEYVVRGDPDEGRFSVVYLRDGHVVAVDSVNNVRDFAQGRLVVEAHAELDVRRLKDTHVSLRECTLTHMTIKSRSPGSH